MVVDVITSAANPLLKEIRKAQAQGTATASGWLIAEGPRLVKEAVRSGLHIHCAITTEDGPPFEGRADRVLEVPSRVFRTFAGTESPQEIMVLAEPPTYTADTLEQGNAPIVILDGLQDPGNAGAIARSAEAFGASGLVFTAGAVNPLAPKVLRSAAGSLFRVPFIRAAEYRPPMRLFAGVARGGAACWQCDFKQPCALLVGNEGTGISPRYARIAEPVHIPTRGVESLNAAVAASVLLYEAARQRAGQ